MLRNDWPPESTHQAAEAKLGSGGEAGLRAKSVFGRGCGG